MGFDSVAMMRPPSQTPIFMSIDLNAIAEQIRAEGYADGYKACLRDMEDFLSGRRAIPSAPTSGSQDGKDASDSTAQRAPRGQTKKWVKSILAAGVNVPMTVKEMQDLLLLTEGDVPYSSIQNALYQLERDGVVETIGRGQWRLKRNTAPSIEIEEAV